ncbi:hypothetical protein [Sphingomonas mesophila]|uniref:hypothetical protein n=1 Tax=Sphingomonas mesophila TaxID=2303576 RepID=UPI000E57C32F|nr:hypothetical protein [Sphingomonas mesophila]
MSLPPIDPRRRAAKAQRAERRGGDLFLVERALGECLDRLAELPGGGNALIITAEPRQWLANAVRSPLPVQSPALLTPHCADTIIALGLFEDAEDPTLTAFVLGQALRPGGRLIGACLGPQSLPRLRAALLDAERAEGRAVQRFNPLPDPASLAAMLTAAGLANVVVDVDRCAVSYRSALHLVRDLRDMGCTASRSAPHVPLSRKIVEQLEINFLGGLERATETFEIQYFSGFAQNAV